MDLDSLSNELDEYILRQMEIQHFPGLSASIVIGDQIVWTGAYGLAHIENYQNVTLDTKFIVASISKLFTATACAQLWENRKLNLDADINEYLPFKIINPNHPDIPITARNLLQHKSSLRDFESDLELWDAPGDPIYSLEEFCSSYFIPGGELFNAENWGDVEPGNTEYWYSNAGFTLLGFLVESISEMPFNEYCQEYILEPLQMNSSGWFYHEVDSTDIAMPYDYYFYPYGYYSLPEYPSATLKTSILELSNFLIAYNQHGVFENSEFIESNTFDMMVPTDMMNGLGWWGKDTWYGDSNGDYWSHGGYMNGVRTQINYYPVDHSGLIILTNGQGSYLPIQNKLEEAILIFKESFTTSNSNFNSSQFTVYPNPTNHGLHIELPNTTLPYKASLINATGNEVFSSTYSSRSIQIDISTLLAGVYFLFIENGSSSWFEKVIISD